MENPQTGGLDAEILSSPSTFFFKIGFPVIWFSLLGAALLQFWRQGDLSHLSTPLLAGLCFIVLLVTTTFFLFTYSLKYVVVEGHSIRFKNYRKIVEIPLSEIKEVNTDFLSNPTIFVLTLKTKTAFDNKIYFAGNYRISPWNNDETKKELARLRNLLLVKN